MYIGFPSTQVTGSFGVVNFIAPDGTLQTFLVIRNASMRAQSYDGGNTSDVAIFLPREFIGPLTGSLASAAATTNSGTF